MNALTFIRKSGLAVLFFIGINSQAGAQFDDLYYDPSSFNNQSSSAHSSSSSSSSSSYDSRGYDNNSYGNYDDASYDGYDDYDYQYASRIRRFHRPNPGFGFYDPFYIDPWYYDPFWVGPADIYVGSSFMWNPWNRWNRWNRWGGGWCGFNSFYNPYFGSPSVVIMNNYGWGWDPYFRPYSPYNHWGWGGGGYYNPGWNSPGWGWGGWNNDNSPSNVVYRPRQGGAVTSTERASPRGGLRSPDGRVQQPGVHDSDPLAPGGRTTPRSGGRNEGVTPDRNSPSREPARAGEETRPTRRFFQMGRDQEAPSRNNDRQSPQEPRRNNQAEPQPSRRSENWRNDNNNNNRRQEEAPTRRQETPTRRNDSPSYERPSTPSHSPSRSSSGSSGSSRSGGSSGGGGSSSPRRGG